MIIKRFTRLVPGILISLCISLIMLGCSSGRSINEYESLTEKGDEAYDNGEYQTALGFYQQALTEAVEAEDKEQEALALHNIGYAYLDQGLPEQALENLQKALSIRATLEDTEGEGKTLIGISLVYNQQGQYEQALNIANQVLAKFEEIGDKEQQGLVLGEIGGLYYDQGKYELALGKFEEAIAIDREVENQEAEAAMLGLMGFTYYLKGSYDQAIESFEQLLELARDLKDITGQARALSGLGASYNNLEQYKKAVDLLEQAQVLSQEVGDTFLEGDTFANLGISYFALEEYSKSLEHFERAISLYQKVDGEDASISLAEAWTKIAFVQQQINDYETALHSYQEALSIYERVGDEELIQIAEENIALLPRFDFNVNLIQNPGNEEPLVNGEIPYWEEVSGVNWGQNAEVPVYEGNAYFDAGEAGQYAVLSQDVDVSGFAASIDQGNQEFTFIAHMRSYPLQPFVPVDSAQVFVEFLDADGEEIDTVKSEEYFSTESWVKVDDVLIAPSGTRWIRISLVSTKYGGYDSDGYFDDLSLIALP